MQDVIVNVNAVQGKEEDRKIKRHVCAGESLIVSCALKCSTQPAHVPIIDNRESSHIRHELSHMAYNDRMQCQAAIP